MPFGLVNSAHKLCSLIDAIFGPKYEPNIFTYLDDIIIISAGHLQLSNKVRDKMKSAINLSKCEFFMYEMEIFRICCRRPRYTYGSGKGSHDGELSSPY